MITTRLRPAPTVVHFYLGYQAITRRSASRLQRTSPNYAGHVPLGGLEKAGLAVGAAVMSLLQPRRADLVAAFGETTASPFFITRLRDVMLSSPTGRRILRDRPRITSTSLDLARLRNLPATTVGHAYASWLTREGVSPDTRCPVRFIDDEECAYVMQRYRESHDFLHALTGLPVVVEGELALKAFEFANTLLPMTGLSLFAVTRLSGPERRRFFSIYLPWAIYNGLKCKEIINVYWEEVLEQDATALRADLGIEMPLDLRDLRRQSKANKRGTHALRN